MDRGAWRAAVHRAALSRTRQVTKQQPHTHLMLGNQIKKYCLSLFFNFTGFIKKFLLEGQLCYLIEQSL